MKQFLGLISFQNLVLYVAGLVLPRMPDPYLIEPLLAFVRNSTPSTLAQVVMRVVEVGVKKKSHVNAWVTGMGHSRR